MWNFRKSVSVRVSFEEKEMRVFAIALALALTLTLFQYPERDLNPHNRNGHRILSPACLPFHHPGNLLSWVDIDNFKFSYKELSLLKGMVECPPLQSGCSLSRHNMSGLNARPYHPGQV